MNKNFITAVTFLFVILFIAPLHAQDTRTLTLEQSIEIAKQNSPLARSAHFGLISAKWRYKSFRADLLPSLELSGDAPNYSRSFRTDLQPDGSTDFIYQRQSDASVELSVNQNILPTGGNLSLSTGISRLGIFRGENTYFWQSTPLVATIRQPLFQFNSLKWR